MATEVKRRRGTTSEHSSFIGAVGETTVDLTKDTVVVHDGSTSGGFPLLREDFSNAVWTTPDARYLLESNNLSDLDSASTGRTNLGLTNASADLDLNSVDIGGSNFVDSSRNVSGNNFNLGSITGGYNIETLSGGAIFKRNSFVFFDLQVPSSGSSTDRFRLNYDGSLVRFNQLDAGSGISFRFEGDTRIFGSDLTVDGDTTTNNTLTINSQLLFTLGQEQLLSEDASPTFAGGTFNGELTVNDEENIALRDLADDSYTLHYFNDGSKFPVRLTLPNDSGTNRYFQIGYYASNSKLNAWTSAIEINAFTGDTDITGNLDVSGDIDIQGSLFASEFVIDQTSVIGGDQLISVARARAVQNATSTGTNTADVVLENPNGRTATTFQTDDFFWVKSVDIDGAEIRNIQGQVTNVTVSGTTITLSLDTTVTNGQGDPANIEAGDILVQRGSSSDAARQAAIYTTASDTGAPFTRFFRNIDALGDFTNTANIAVQIGTAQDITGYSEPGIFGHKTDGTVGFALNQGKFFYDGIGKTIYRGQNVAGFTTNASASSLTDDEWEEESVVNTDGSGNGSDSDTHTKVRLRWKKRFGIDNLLLNLRYRAVFTTDGSPNASSTAEIIFRVSDTEDDATPLVEDTTGISVNQSLTEDNLTLDVSSLTDDSTYFVEVEMATSVTASGATASETYRQELFMREDIEIIETT